MYIWGKGRVGSDFLSAIAGRVGSTFRRVGSGLRKVTRGQLWCPLIWCDWDIMLTHYIVTLNSRLGSNAIDLKQTKTNISCGVGRRPPLPRQWGIFVSFFHVFSPTHVLSDTVHNKSFEGTHALWEYIFECVSWTHDGFMTMLRIVMISWLKSPEMPSYVHHSDQLAQEPVIEKIIIN